MAFVIVCLNGMPGSVADECCEIRTHEAVGYQMIPGSWWLFLVFLHVFAKCWDIPWISGTAQLRLWLSHWSASAVILGQHFGAKTITAVYALLLRRFYDFSIIFLYTINGFGIAFRPSERHKTVQFLVTPSEAQKNQPPSHVFAPPSLHLTRCMRFVFASTVLRCPKGVWPHPGTTMGSTMVYRYTIGIPICPKCWPNNKGKWQWWVTR